MLLFQDATLLTISYVHTFADAISSTNFFTAKKKYQQLFLMTMILYIHWAKKPPGRTMAIFGNY
ncbi:hypothetical protein N7517_008465 [Penicillium concentricum]|uniref:Uncharacterized protein n=1 Tax=Penicillium concentricum TaxID=293559 RepID=A0A9W9RUN5_9EURO|nr:uncharacterized protein N7517_008465 [Penicillium concentricum]KAJ5365579.1 hypothetical protein N7517_008465 [Penicillium concentricum]